nr:GIY-YIG nuclease family protein [uncultured Peptostreptococcus sp.]
MIKLVDLVKTDDMEYTKIKFHKNEGDVSRPAYDMLLDEPETWLRMNQWRENNNNHNLDRAKYLVSMAQYYPYSKDYYIFGGLYKVDEDHLDQYSCEGYKLEKVNEYDDYEKRLIVRINDPVKLSLSYLRWYINAQEDLEMEVYEIAPSTKTLNFTGYQNVSLSHKDLVRIISNDEPTYRQALSHVKGVYVITDTNTGKLYIGSASGNSEGIWQRWSCYANNLNPTGENKKLIEIFEENEEYIQKHCKYSVLEIFDTKTKEEDIIQRENYWKKVFETKKFGYNEN